MAYDSVRDRVVLFGGRDRQNYILWDTWEWDGNDWILRYPSRRPPARSEHAMAYDPVNRRTVLFGGSNSPRYDSDTPGELLDDTWVWDGTSWTQLFPETSPPPLE